MPVRRAQSINELYDQVATYDLVLTSDAPLSLALNRRIDTPRLGRFAATPRMIASGAFRPEDRRTLFHELIRRTNLEWKHADYLLEHILGCWEETGSIDSLRGYDRFDTPETQVAIEVIDATPNTHGDLDGYVVDDDIEVAIIGEAYFTALDRSILPSTYDTFSPFDTASIFDLPEFRVFESATAIVDAVVENVSADTAANVAVVMDSAGQFPPLIESALAVNDIPFHGGPGFVDDLGVRTYLRLLRMASAGRDVLLRDLQPILEFMGVETPTADHEKRLDYLDLPALDPVQQFFETVEEHTFAEAVDVLAEQTSRSLIDLHDELERLGIADQAITERCVDDLSFYLESFDVPTDQDNRGVLLADPSAAAYVDRPLVFFLGMDKSWTQRIPDRPWIDATERDRHHLERFQVLIQNGQQQYYLVQDTASGNPVTPCLYFHDILDMEFERFADLPHRRHARYGRESNRAFERHPLDIEPTEIELLSQSSLNTFVNSPRDYLFDRLIESPDKAHFKKGNLIHDFAEFCVAHPAFADDLETREIVEFMLSELAPFVDDLELELLRTEFEVAVELIRTYLEGDPPKADDYETYYRSRGSNMFAERFDRPIESTFTEQSFSNYDIGARGKVDLIHSPTRLLDYKSGSSKPSPTSIIRKSSFDPIDDAPNFQAPMYLAHHRQEVTDTDLRFTFFHVLSVLDDAVTDDVSPEDALVKILYHPQPFVDFVAGEAAFDALTANVSENNNRRKTLEHLGFDRYASFLESHAIPDTDDKADLLDSTIHDEFVAHAQAEVGEYKYVKRGITSTLKKLIDIRRRRFFADDIDAIEGFLDKQRDLLNEYRRDRFPVGDPNVDRLNNRDLIRPDD